MNPYVFSAHGWGIPDKIQDADGDTKIQVEESADEDIVRMDVKGVESFVLDDAGVLTMVKQSCLKVYRGADQAVGTGAWHQIEFDAVEFDIQDEYDEAVDYQFTAKTEGNYLISCVIGVFRPGVGKRFAILITTGGTGAAARIAEIQMHSSVDFAIGVPSLQFAHLGIGDHIEIYFYHDKGVDVAVRGGAHLTYLAIAKLS